MKIFQITTIFLIFALPYSCEEESMGGQYGIVLTVDDGYIDYWHDYLDYFESKNVKLTFYISCYNRLGTEQKIKLKDIGKRGHVIAFHGTNHVGVPITTNEDSIWKYIQDEIVDGVALMKLDSIDVNHFAYPYGTNTPMVDEILLDYFQSIRKISWTSDNQHLKDLKDVHFKVPCSERILRGAGIDSAYNMPEEEIFEALDELSPKGEVLLLYCHRLCNLPGNWNISIDKLKSIVEYCYVEDIPFLTVDEMFY